MALAIGIIIFLLLIIVGLARSESGGDSQIEDFPAPPPRHHSRENKHEKNHFIHQHQHRNDERHERHKRNQTPW